MVSCNTPTNWLLYVVHLRTVQIRAGCTPHINLCGSTDVQHGVEAIATDEDVGECWSSRHRIRLRYIQRGQPRAELRGPYDCELQWARPGDVDAGRKVISNQPSNERPGWVLAQAIADDTPIAVRALVDAGDVVEAFADLDRDGVGPVGLLAAGQHDQRAPFADHPIGPDGAQLALPLPPCSPPHTKCSAPNGPINNPGTKEHSGGLTPRSRRSRRREPGGARPLSTRSARCGSRSRSSSSSRRDSPSTPRSAPGREPTE